MKWSIVTVNQRTFGFHIHSFVEDKCRLALNLKTVYCCRQKQVPGSTAYGKLLHPSHSACHAPTCGAHLLKGVVRRVQRFAQSALASVRRRATQPVDLDKLHYCVLLCDRSEAFSTQRRLPCKQRGRGERDPSTSPRPSREDMATRRTVAAVIQMVVPRKKSKMRNANLYPKPARASAWTVCASPSMLTQRGHFRERT